MSRTPNHNVTGAWLEGDDPGERQFIKIGYLLLENGETLPDITIAYQSWGTLNKDKSNAILINHAMTGWSDVTGWWPQMVGPGLPFDIARVDGKQRTIGQKPTGAQIVGVVICTATRCERG